MVVIADWLFTATTVVFQPLSGLYMLHLSHLPLSAPWLTWSVWLYAIAVACWIPVVWIQIRLRDLAIASAEKGVSLPAAYWRYFYVWIALGIPAFFGFIAVFYLMVVKLTP